MKKHSLALLLAVGIATTPQTSQSVSWQDCATGALLIASLVSAKAVKTDYNRHYDDARRSRYAQGIVTAWAIYHSISALHKAYKKSKDDQNTITVTTG